MSGRGPGTAEDDRLLTFEVAGSVFALPIWGVIEVAEIAELACVPSVPPSVAGVLNYKGDALPVVRRERLLDLEAGGVSEPEHVLVVTDRALGSARLGLDVDRVLGLVDGSAASAHGSGPVAERRPIDGRVARILDPSRLIERAQGVIEASLASGE